MAGCGADGHAAARMQIGAWAESQLGQSACCTRQLGALRTAGQRQDRWPLAKIWPSASTRSEWPKPRLPLVTLLILLVFRLFKKI